MHDLQLITGTQVGQKAPSGLYVSDKHHSLAFADIETASTADNAGIFSIGVVVLDLSTLELCEREFFRQIRQNSWPEHQGHVCPETMKWWEKQSAQARALVFNEEEAVSLEDALIDLKDFLTDLQVTDIVGNGPEFDCSILNHALEGYDIDLMGNTRLPDAPFYSSNQSHRTLMLTARTLIGYDYKYADFIGIKHHSLDDARHEAKTAAAGMRDVVALLEDGRKYRNSQLDAA